MLFGEMGNGKSTTGNHLIKQLLEKQNKSFKKDNAFVASKAVKAVTKRMHIKYFKEMGVLDSPGFNDPDKERTDAQIFIDMTNCLNERDILDEGIACILQCVMVPASGRVNGTAVALMSKMLQVFTLSYPDSGKDGPKAKVLFTNFSAYDTNDGSGDISFDE